MKECKLHIVLVFLFVAMSLSSCSRPMRCDLYNNTSKPIQIIIKDKRGEEPERHLSIMPGRSKALSVWGNYIYVVSTEYRTWSYEPRHTIHIPDYVKPTGIGRFYKRLLEAQLNADGKIFLIKKELSFPVPENIEQPEGFPLLPKVLR